MIAAAASIAILFDNLSGVFQEVYIASLSNTVRRACTAFSWQLFVEHEWRACSIV